MPPTDPSLFVRLLLQHQNDLLRYVLPLVGCLDDAEDVLQDVATALWKKFDQYDERQPFLPWARRFAHHEVLMYHRRRRKYTFLTEELIETLAEQSAECHLQAERRRSALHSCLEKLGEADRRLLGQRYGERRTTIQQLAAELQQNANVIYKSLARIRRQLVDCVGRTLLAADSV